MRSRDQHHHLFLSFFFNFYSFFFSFSLSPSLPPPSLEGAICAPLLLPSNQCAHLHAFHLPCARVLVSPGGQLIYSFNAWFLYLVTWFLLLPFRGHPCLPGGQECCVAGSPETVTVERQFLADYHPQGTTQAAESKTLPVFLTKSPISLSRSLAWGASIWLDKEGKSLRRWFQVMDTSECNLCVSICLLQLNGIFQKGAYILASCPDFCSNFGRDTSISPGSCGLSGLCSWVPQGYIQWRKSSQIATPLGQSKRQQTQKLNFSMKEPINLSS